MVKPYLDGLKLEEAMVLNKIYVVNYKDVLDIRCKGDKKVRL